VANSAPLQTVTKVLGRRITAKEKGNDKWILINNVKITVSNSHHRKTKYINAAE